jgi:hypothetical protein
LVISLGADDRLVDIDDQHVTGRASTCSPRPLTCGRTSRRDAAQLARAHTLEDGNVRLTRAPVDVSQHQSSPGRRASSCDGQDSLCKVRS